MQATEEDLEWGDIEKSIKIILKAHDENDEQSIRSLLLKNVDGYNPVKN